MRNLIIAAVIFGASAVPQVAQAEIGRPFDAPALSTAELANVRGQALRRPFGRDVKLLATTDSATFLRQTGEASRVGLDNWFTDVGSPLIIANIAGSSLPR